MPSTTQTSMLLRRHGIGVRMLWHFCPVYADSAQRRPLAKYIPAHDTCPVRPPSWAILSPSADPSQASCLLLVNIYRLLPYLLLTASLTTPAQNPMPAERSRRLCRLSGTGIRLLRVLYCRDVAVHVGREAEQQHACVKYFTDESLCCQQVREQRRGRPVSDACARRPLQCWPDRWSRPFSGSAQRSWMVQCMSLLLTASGRCCQRMAEDSLSC